MWLALHNVLYSFSGSSSQWFLWNWHGLIYDIRFVLVSLFYDGPPRVAFPISASDNGHIGPAERMSLANITKMWCCSSILLDSCQKCFFFLFPIQNPMFSCFSSNQTRYLIFFILKGDVLEIHFCLCVDRTHVWYDLFPVPFSVYNLLDRSHNIGL